MRFVIITGLSGAGKTQALRCLEDMGFYCVDNMPPALLGKFAQMCCQSQGKLSQVAMVVDVRGGEMFNFIAEELEELKKIDCNYEIVFLEASDKTLVQRYKESRRTHPLSPGSRVEEGIAAERCMLENVKNAADYIIDTSNMKPQHLKANIKSLFSEDLGKNRMVINVLSFGFKYGIPLDSDLVFDVRFIPNPFYIPELKHKTGKNREVEDFVMESEQSRAFLEKLIDMVKFLIPQYVEEGKGNLVISIGCTGGKHRSVAMGEKLYDELLSDKNNCVINHRDIDKK